MNDYLFGLATLPAIAVTVAVLFYGSRGIAAATVRTFRHLPLSTPTSRARFAVAAASSRRVHMIGFGGVSVVLALGYDPTNARPMYDAIYGVLASPATVNPRFRGSSATSGTEEE